MDGQKTQPAHLRDIKNLVGETDASLFSANIFSKDLLSRVTEQMKQSTGSAQQSSKSVTSHPRKMKKTRKRNVVDIECDSDEDCVVLSQGSTECARQGSPTKRSRRSAKSAVADTGSSQSSDEIQHPKETLKMLQKLQKAEEAIYIDLSDESSDSISCTEVVSPVKREKLVIIVKCQATLLNYSTSPEAPLSDILEKVAEEHGVDVSQVTLLCKNRKVQPEDTPKSLNLAAADILEAVITKYRETGKGKNTICIKFQCSNKRKNENVEVSLVEPLREGAVVLAEKLGLPLSQLTFKFDGEFVDLKTTPQELGIEDDDCVDVCIQS